MDITAIRKTYNRYARFYNLYFGSVMHPGRKAVVNKLGCKSGDRILEVGIGTGLSIPLYPPTTHITGIDISSTMLERAHAYYTKKGLQNVDLAIMDAENMSFPDNIFDKAVCMYVVSVAPHPERLINEMRRVCKPDGELLIVNHFQHQNQLISSLERLIAPLSDLLGFRPDLSLDTFLADTRLEITECSPVNLFGYWTLLRAPNNKETMDDVLARQATA